MKVKMKPEFVYVLTAIKRDAAGNEMSRRMSDECHNVFTNYGVEALFGATTGDNVTSLAGVVGAGSAAPLVSNTVLQSFIAGRYTDSRSLPSSFVDNGDGTGYVESQWDSVFPAGVATGIIAEVGSAFRSTNPIATTPLCSRALVVDGAGNPTTFEVLADEELQLKQYFRRHFSYRDRTAVLTENGNEHTVALRPAGLASLSALWRFPMPFMADSSGNTMLGYSTGGSPVATLVPITSNTTLSVVGGTGNTQDNTSQGAQAGLESYTPGSKKRRMYVRHPTGRALLESWGKLDTGCCGSWQYTVTPPVNKSVLHRYTITFEFEIDNAP